VGTADIYIDFDKVYLLFLKVFFEFKIAIGFG